jgi:hypothetical protein
MAIIQRIFGCFSSLMLAIAITGCGGTHVGDEQVTESDTSGLTVPYSAIDLGAGTVKYSVTLPSGQHYVEVFARKNGVQNVAHNITSSGVVNANGSTTYSYEKSGYQAGDAIEYRFYSYIGPAVFTPGPAQSAWVSFNYGGASVFKTSTGDYLLGNQKDASGRSFSYQIATSSGGTQITPFGTGWFTTRASPTGTEVEVLSAEADLIGAFVKRAGSNLYDPVASYDTYTINALRDPHWLDITVEPDTAVYPGERINQTYAEGGRFVTIQTLIGPQSVYTDATVSFAFLIQQKTWIGE